MQVEYHVMVLHFFKYRIISFVALNTSIASGGNATGVAFDPNNASRFGFLYLFGSEFGGEEECHEELRLRGDGL